MTKGLIVIDIFEMAHKHAHLNLFDAISASWVWRLVFMMRAYWGSGLETQAKGLKPLIKKLVFYTDFQ